MPKSKAEAAADRMLGEIDDALGQTPVLTGSQRDDVDRLRADIAAHCRAGDLERARGCRKLALDLIRSGAPAPE